MHVTVTPEADNAIADIAQRYGLARESVLAMLLAVNVGGGTMAQFSVPELGSGQWMRGGMTMVADMFDNALKARVDGLCGELSQLLATTQVFPAPTADHQVGFTSAGWWPGDLGTPSSSGGQNDARYAIFPSARRLAIQVNGVTRVFDAGDHQIGGVQQQQGGGYGSMSFTSQFGTFDVSSLRELGTQQAPEPPSTGPTAPASGNTGSGTPASGTPASGTPASGTPVSGTPPFDTAAFGNPASVNPASGNPSPGDSGAIIAAIESLAGLHQRGILTDEEFATKKSELLGRL